MGLFFLVYGGYLELFIGIGVVGMRSGDFLVSDFVFVYYEEVVV